MSRIRTAYELGLVSCHACGLLCRWEGDLAEGYDCPRCGTALRRRKQNSLSRTLALLIAAAVLYLPANFFTIMSTRSLLETEDHTILGGVMELWEAGSWDLALIVFTASIVVPIFKLVSLSVLWVCVARGLHWRTSQHARIYRIIEAVGHWSMLDVFVVALMVSLVRFGQVAQVEAGPGAVAFGAVVVLTMLASKSFDPRLLWDAQDNEIRADVSASAALENTSSR